jgi:PAS domain-containing protein
MLRQFSRGTVFLPSLILRLEPLPSGGESPPAASSGSAMPQDAATQPAAPASAPATPTGSTNPTEPTNPTDSRPRERRTIDVAASERLSTATPLSRWSAAVAAAHDACFVLDVEGVVISVSVAAVELLGCGDSAVIGHHLLDVITLVDLETGAPNPSYAARITPLAVLEGPGLARSIMRVRHVDNTVVTLDSSSAPIHDVTAHLLGSVTFLAPIPAR